MRGTLKKITLSPKTADRKFFDDICESENDKFNDYLSKAQSMEKTKFNLTFRERSNFHVSSLDPMSQQTASKSSILTLIAFCLSSIGLCVYNILISISQLII